MVVGIDAGGTATRILLADEEGTPIFEANGASEAGGGPIVLERALVESLIQSCPTGRRIESVCAGVTKFTRAGVRERWEQHLQQAFPQALVSVEPDYVIAFEGGTGGVGVAVVAGTGSVAYGQDRAKNAARVGGRGWEYGDQGSGAWLTAEAIRRTLLALDGIEAATPLTEAVCAHLGSQDATLLGEAARRAAESGEGRGFLTPLILQRARDDDREARNLFLGAAGWLSLLVRGLVRQLEFRGESSVPVVTVGGLWSGGSEFLLEPFRQSVRQFLPRAVVQTPHAAPVVGAVNRALRVVRGQLPPIALPTPRTGSPQGRSTPPRALPPVRR